MTPPASPQPPSEPTAAARFFGLMLMAVGGLMALLSGLCSLAMIASTFASVFRLGAQPHMGNLWLGLVMMVPVIVIFGGVPTAAGVVTFIVGRNLWRPRPKAPGA